MIASATAIACSTEGERTSPSTGISFSAASGCASSASRSVGSGASRTLSSISASNPASAPRFRHDWPTVCSWTAPSSNAAALSAATSSSDSSRAPSRWSSATIASHTGSSMMAVCSAGQITDESKVLEISMSTAAIPTSALRWT